MACDCVQIAATILLTRYQMPVLYSFYGHR
jgi:hypothetical protein